MLGPAIVLQLARMAELFLLRVRVHAMVEVALRSKALPAGTEILTRDAAQHIVKDIAAQAALPTPDQTAAL